MNMQTIGNTTTTSLPSVVPTPARLEAAIDAQRSPASNSSGEVRAVEEAPALAASREPLRQQVEEAVRHVQEFVQPINQNIEFTLDDDTGKVVVKVVDVATKEVVKQIPSEEMLAIAKALDRLQGLLVRSKA